MVIKKSYLGIKNNLVVNGIYQGEGPKDVVFFFFFFI